jgi:hypothetical protein
VRLTEDGWPSFPPDEAEPLLLFLPIAGIVADVKRADGVLMELHGAR